MAHGGSGHRGLCVIKVAMEEREKGIDSVTIHFPYMVEMTVLEIGMNEKIAIQKAVLVSEKISCVTSAFCKGYLRKTLWESLQFYSVHRSFTNVKMYLLASIRSKRVFTYTSCNCQIQTPGHLHIRLGHISIPFRTVIVFSPLEMHVYPYI